MGAYGSVSFLTFSFNFIFLFIHIHTSLKWQILKPSLKTILVLTCTSLNRCIYHTIIMSYHRQCSSESGGSSLLFKSTIFLNFLFKISTESYRKTIGSCPFTFKHDDACQYQSTFTTKKRNTHKQIKAGIKEHQCVVWETQWSQIRCLVKNKRRKRESSKRDVSVTNKNIMDNMIMIKKVLVNYMLLLK